MKRERFLGLSVALLAVAALVTINVACNKGGDTVTGPDTDFTSTAPPPSNTATAPADGQQGVAETPTVAPAGDAIGVELLSSNFDPQRCTDLSLPEHQGKTVLEEVARITNNTELEVYPYPALFQSRVATCSPHDRHPAGEDVTSQLVIGANVAPGQSGEWTHRLAIPRDFCGSLQLDSDARNGEVKKSSLGGGAGGKVINSGVDCPDCVEEWIEQEPVIDEGEYGECVPSDVGASTENHVSKCYRSRTNIVTIKEINSCTEEIRVKSTEEVVETEPCECPCIVEWIEQEPVTEEGEYGECMPVAAAQGQCARSRTDVVTIYEVNSCTEEQRIKSQDEVSQSESCECLCAPPDFSLSDLQVDTVTQTVYTYWYDGKSGLENDCRNDGGTFYDRYGSRRNVCKTNNYHGDVWSYDHNESAELFHTTSEEKVVSSTVSGSASVFSEGNWKLVLKAWQPGDYTKDQDTANLECNGEATLNVSYNWKGHSSEKWQLQLYRNGSQVAASPVLNNPYN